MSLSDLASIGSFVSGVAVLVSLVFLYIQLRQLNAQARQNARHTEALIFQGGAARSASQMMAMADADLVAAAILGNGGEATPEAIKAGQFRLIWRTHFITWGDNYSQYANGLISKQAFASLRAIMVESLRANPGYVALYLEYLGNEASEAGFNSFVREVCAEVDSSPIELAAS